MSAFDPVAADKFSFGLWTVGNPGRDPFGGPVRPTLDPVQLVEGLAACGAWGVNLHDNDLVPFGASATERDNIVARFKAAVKRCGMCVPMTTCNLFSHPIFKDGAFTSNDPAVRAFAVRKCMDALDLAHDLGSSVFVFWGGREGTEADACRSPIVAVRHMREALNFLCGYVKERRYDIVFALEAKPNEPRSDTYFPTTGHMLHFISTLQHQEMVGVNPEVAHETMAGLSMVHGVGQAMEAGKLFHIDLNAQKIGRYDQDLRFGSEDVRGAFLLVRLLEGSAGNAPYTGSLHFDAHAYRTEDQQGVWDFATGCMRTYKILKARAFAFDADPEVRDLLGGQGNTALNDALAAGWSLERGAALRAAVIDPDAIGAKGLRYERLDQIMIEHLLGARG
ncbi:MAG: xylose isomerase [Planctomycetes bacterium]|nr:xylose isomerase [Planctomycetota bacterium]